MCGVGISIALLTLGLFNQHTGIVDCYDEQHSSILDLECEGSVPDEGYEWITKTAAAIVMVSVMVVLFAGLATISKRLEED